MARINRKGASTGGGGGGTITSVVDTATIDLNVSGGGALTASVIANSITGTHISTAADVQINSMGVGGPPNPDPGSLIATAYFGADAGAGPYSVMESNGHVSSNVAAASSLGWSVAIVGEALDRITFLGDGSFHWTDGTNPADTNLYRLSAGLLTTDQSFKARGVGGVTVGPDGLDAAGVPNAAFNYAGYFVPADISNPSGQGPALSLWPKDTQVVTESAFYTNRWSDPNRMFEFTYEGKMNWGSGSASADATLYRSSPGRLTVTNTFAVENPGVSVTTLHTDGNISVGAVNTTDYTFTAGLFTDDWGRWNVLASGENRWGPGGLSVPDNTDISLKRGGTAQLKITPGANASASVTTGGALLLDNTLSSGAGLVVTSAHASTQSGRLAVFTVTNAAFEQAVVRIENAGTNAALSINNTGTSTGPSALDVNSTDRTVSAIGFKGTETGKGTLKVTHSHPVGASANDDANAAILRLNWEDVTAGNNGTAVQGIFMATEGGASGAATTGDLIKVWNGTSTGGTSTTKFWLNANGQLALNTTGTTGGLTLGADVQLYRSAADKLSLGAGDSFDSPTILTPTIASFTNAQHNHTNAAGGGQLTGAAFSSTTGSGAVVLATSPTIVTPTIASFANANHDHSNSAGGGNITGTAFATQTANTVFAGPTSGGAATATFRALVAADIPTSLPSLLHSSLSGLTSGDDHTQYAYLAGRNLGQTLIGDTASGGNLTLQSTSHATRGRVNAADTIGLLSAGVTTGNAIVYGAIMDTAVSMGGGTTARLTALSFSPTITVTGTVAASSLVLFAFVGSITPDASGRDFKGQNVFNNSGTWNGNSGGTVTSGNTVTLLHAPTFGTIGGGGTGASSAVYALQVQGTVNSGWTVTDWQPIRIENPTLGGTGAITTLTGIEIRSLTRGTTNIAIEQLGTSVENRFAGPFRVGVAGAVSGFSASDPTMELERLSTITGTVADGLSGSLLLDPGYTAATAQTVTRHNYIKLEDVSNAGAGPSAVTDSCVFWFDAAAGTHKATKGTGGGVGCTIGDGPTGANAGNPLGWMILNLNGTKRYSPFW